MNIKATECSFDYSSSEEMKAHQIWLDINRYYSEIKGYQTNDFPIEFLEEINFEILNRKDLGRGKRNLLIIGNTYKPIDLKLLNSHMRSMGINKEFIDRSEPYKEGDLDTKQYLVIHPK